MTEAKTAAEAGARGAPPGLRWRLSIVVPALDEAAGIAATLRALAPLRNRGHEVIVVDGGSADATAAIAAPLCTRLLQAPRGRARQMNAGAAAARGDALLFLHADTVLPPGADAAVRAALAGARWGRFDVTIVGRSPALRVVAAAMNRRSRLTGIATGDQAIFVDADTWRAAGGYAEQPLMEDVELSRRLLAVAGRPSCLRERVLTSGRRWESRGVIRTVWLMWRLRWRYWRGTPAEALARAYE